MNTYKIGDQVIVTHERGRETGIVLGYTRPNFNMITVQFADGTNSTWPNDAVAPFNQTTTTDEECEVCGECETLCSCIRCMECEELFAETDEMSTDDDGEFICTECAGE